LPVGELLGERAVRCGQVLDPLTDVAGRLRRGKGELVALAAVCQVLIDARTDLVLVDLRSTTSTTAPRPGRTCRIT
jgi:hypothetical protein